MQGACEQTAREFASKKQPCDDCQSEGEGKEGISTWVIRGGVDYQFDVLDEAVETFEKKGKVFNGCRHWNFVQQPIQKQVCLLKVNSQGLAFSLLESVQCVECLKMMSMRVGYRSEGFSDLHSCLNRQEFACHHSSKMHQQVLQEGHIHKMPKLSNTWMIIRVRAGPVVN